MLFIMSTFAAITEASRFQFPDQSYLYTILRITSQRIFNTNKCCNINTWSFPDPISSTYIPQEWKHCWATVYVNCVRRLHGGPLFSVPLCRPSWQHLRTAQSCCPSTSCFEFRWSFLWSLFRHVRSIMSVRSYGQYKQLIKKQLYQRRYEKSACLPNRKLR